MREPQRITRGTKETMVVANNRRNGEIGGKTDTETEEERRATEGWNIVQYSGISKGMLQFCFHFTLALAM